MVLVLSILIAFSLAAIPLTRRSLIRLSSHSIPATQELNTPRGFSFCHHHPLLKSCQASSIYFFKTRRHSFYPHDLRLYSIFDWVNKFDQEDKLLQKAKAYLRQAKLAALRLLLLRAASVFETLRPEPPAHPRVINLGNRNFLHIGRVHRLAQP